MTPISAFKTRTLRVVTLSALAAASALGLAACAVELQNTQAAHEMARRAQPPGSVYTGWRVFQDRCAGCHGPAATGLSGGAPDLLPRVREMSSRRFVSLVLTRYDWSSVPAAQPGHSAREALVDEVVLRKQGLLTMPAWQGEPRVTAHIADLYAYLAARAEGTQGPGRPAP